MTKNVKIAIAIGSGLAVGFGGWYLYQYMQKRNEAKKLANLTQPDEAKPTSANVPTPSTVNTPVATTFSAPIVLSGQKPLKFNPKLQQSVSIANQSENTASSFNGQEMVTRYQRPFWTVGG